MATLAETPQQLIDRQVPLAAKIIADYHASELGQSKRTLHIVYWTPKDREPAPQYRQRLSRVILDIREFYRTQLQRLGFGERTFDVEQDAEGLVKIHLVRGESDYTHYDVQSGSAIRRECLPTLRQAGIDATKETIVLFCNLSNWDAQAKTINQNSPYYASGTLRSGTAWQVDSPILDAASLEAKQPMLRDGQYGRISLGKYNSIFIGGVCHELGHALGLPHNKERPDEGKAFGTALMGSGNRTYGDDRRGEGRGSFLTMAEGLRLAAHPLFTHSEKGIDLPASANVEITNLSSDAKGSFELSGIIKADPPAYAVVGYMDPAGGSDYDATTTTCIPDADGKFVLVCNALKKNSKSLLRVVVCQTNGGRINDSTLELPFEVDESGRVDLQTITDSLRLKSLSDAIVASDGMAAKIEQEKLLAGLGDTVRESRLREVAESLVRSLRSSEAPSPAEVTSESAWLSDLKWKSAKVGWGKAQANRLPYDNPLIIVGHQLFARGLYAHAKSEYVYELGGKWKRFRAQAGLADGHEGTVVFVVQTDGKEIYRSSRINDPSLATIDLDLTGAKSLSLIVEDAGDGNGADWGVWIDPRLTR